MLYVTVRKEIAFQFKRDTKNTYRFYESGNNPVTGTLYVKNPISRKSSRK